MSIDFAIKLSKINITDEKELQQIIKLFHDVKQSHRSKLLKQIQNVTSSLEKEDCNYLKIEFHKYIEKIGKIKTAFLEDIRKKEDEEKKIREEINRIQKEKEEKTSNIIKQDTCDQYDQESEYEIIQYTETNKLTNQVSEVNVTQHIDIEDRDKYNIKLQKIIEKNNSSVYINTKIRHPELQNIYREAIVKRFKNCIVSNMDHEVCEASHIIPFSESESFDIDNGLLLNSVLHKLFDKHYWSICPDTLCIEIFVPSTKNDIYNILEPYKNKYLDVLKQHVNITKYLTNHYKIACSAKE